jgi:peptidoglycan hydrolase-like protein with peptidoglycan-binding domain
VLDQLDLVIGAYGSAVGTLQEALRARGYSVPSAESERQFFGPYTRDALAGFQRDLRLSPTGKLDSSTRVALASRGAGTSGNNVQSVDYSGRDREGRFTFYVLLWRRPDVPLTSFDDYWRDVHGPVCARLPGQFQYWQHHVASADPLPAGAGFDGIAELTFRTAADRQTWFDAAAILMDDEHNIFSKAIGYVTTEGNSTTFVDRLPVGDPNGEVQATKSHVMVRRRPGASDSDFRRFLRDEFAPSLSRHESVRKLRLHLFETPDVSRPGAPGVIHDERPEDQYQAAFEIAVDDDSAMRRVETSDQFARLTGGSSPVGTVVRYRERNSYAFVYAGTMTVAGQRGSRTAELIERLNATNQLAPDIRALMVGGGAGPVPAPAPATRASQAPAPPAPPASQEQHSQLKPRVNFYVDLAADYSRPEPIPPALSDELLRNAEQYIAMTEPDLPEISPSYSLEQIERENKAWWPTHCEALRRGRGDLLTAEYVENLVYFCQDGPYYGLDDQKVREKHWWALLAGPGVIMTWPIVMFHGEFVWFEWACLDRTTFETIAKGSVAWVRRGHRGGCYFKGEQLTFYRDVFAPEELLRLVTT